MRDEGEDRVGVGVRGRVVEGVAALSRVGDDETTDTSVAVATPIGRVELITAGGVLLGLEVDESDVGGELDDGRMGSHAGDVRARGGGDHEARLPLEGDAGAAVGGVGDADAPGACRAGGGGSTDLLLVDDQEALVAPLMVWRTTAGLPTFESRGPSMSVNAVAVWARAPVARRCSKSMGGSGELDQCPSLHATRATTTGDYRLSPVSCSHSR